MSVCPKTAIELTREQYDLLVEKEDPITLKNLLDIRDPVIIGNNSLNVYSLSELMPHIMKYDGGRGVNRCRAADPMDPSKYIKLTNLQGVHYNFDGRDNSEDYENTEQTLSNFTGIDKETRYKNIDHFAFKPYEHDTRISVDEIYILVKQYMEDHLHLHNKREVIYTSILYESIRNYARLINSQSPSQNALDISRQSDQAFSRAIAKYMKEYPGKILDIMGGKKYYMLNPIDIPKVFVAFCYNHVNHKTYTNEELLNVFKRFLNRHRIESQDLKDSDIINYIENAASDHIGSRHLKIDRVPIHDTIAGTGGYTNLYHIGRNIVSMSVLFYYYL
jgi:hypothetical protein